LSSASRQHLKSAKEYVDVLNQRDPKKKENTQKLRELSVEKEIQECSFKPTTLKVPSKFRLDNVTSNLASEIDISKKELSQMQRDLDKLQENEAKEHGPFNLQHSAGNLTQPYERSHSHTGSIMSYIDKYLNRPKVREDPDMNELDYERQKQECTFQPNSITAHRPLTSRVTETRHMSTSDFPSQHSRPTGQELSKSGHRKTASMAKYDNRVVFQMEIKVGQLVDQIVVRKKDTIEEVVFAFAQKHKLSDGKQQRIAALVSSTIEQYKEQQSARTNKAGTQR
jgi:hypothetical protein